MKHTLISLMALLLGGIASAQEYHIVETFHCPDATQGVAVDNQAFYAIGNQVITKYNLQGDSLTSWHESNPQLIKHFDGGIIIDGLLYCSHSNFPEVPMASSIEVFNPKTLKHVNTISFGIEFGSCTWIVRGEKCWYVCFAHYSRSGYNAGGETLHDNSWTQIVQFDDQWRRMQGWILPEELLAELAPNSLSGAIYIDGKFYCTGHDATKLFILEFPPYGMRLCLTDTIDIPYKGQGIALDSKGNLWGIDRKKQLILKASRL